jgi:hypothetical protein
MLQVRPEFPAPQPGQLPLPRSLPPQLQQQLTGELPGWQQLPWPAGQAPQQRQPNPKAALQFKVGGWLVSSLFKASLLDCSRCGQGLCKTQLALRAQQHLQTHPRGP